MSPHISYHPLGTDTIRRYVGYLSSQDPAGLAGIDYDASGAHERFRESFVAMATRAQTLGGEFDESHGLNLAVTQGFFGRFHYLHDARLSDLGAAIEPYAQTWAELLPTWPATARARNRLADGPASGVVIASEHVGRFMADAHTDPALQAGLAEHFPGEKLHVLWAALTEAHELGFALLEASGVFEPDPADITRSQSRTNQTNCDPAGLRLFLATPITPTATAAPAVPTPDPVRPPAPQSTPPPIADSSTVGQMDWEPAVVMLGNAHGARKELVFGPHGFLETWQHGDGLMSLVHPASSLGLALWFDWKEDFLVEERCRAMADWRIGWPDEDFARREELQFSWDGADQSGKVHEALMAFDQWLEARGGGMRLVAVQTHGDFYVSFLYPAADAYQFIEALGAAGVEATMQDGSIPARPAGMAPAPISAAAAGPAAAADAARKLPGAPSLSERMRQRSNNPEPPPGY